MGMDGAVVHMVENYYMQDKCDWVDGENNSKIVEEKKKLLQFNRKSCS